MRRLCILGSTGSIGTQTLEIVRENPDSYSVEALACGRNVELLAQQIQEFSPKAVSVGSPEDADMLRSRFPGLEVYCGDQGLAELASGSDCDMVVNSLVGMAGLVPTYRAIDAGRDVALANKETLVAGGALIMKAAADKGVSILPVDSEHSAVWQCMRGYDRASVSKIILTASGGPFRGRKRDQLIGVTPEEALDHPNWSMGAKITIDSATLMNKGFEVIEARWLFDMQPEAIDVVVHPQSIIHSMVEFDDHAVLAQLGLPDMKVPISLALAYPDRLPNRMPSPDFAEIASLTFERPDKETFRCLALAYEALKAGDTYCTALNAANEVCVEAFLKKKIGFLAIQDTLDRILQEHSAAAGDNLESILEADRYTRERTRELLGL